MEDTTITNALKAARWAVQPYPADPTKTRFEVLLERLNREANRPGKMTIMRNQASMGMNNNYWPCISRLVIMHTPGFAYYIHPRHVRELDSASGIAFLNRVYADVTHKTPTIANWKNAIKYMRGE